MQVEKTTLPDVLLLTPRRLMDERGFFSEVFRQDRFTAAVGPVDLVQHNHSRSERRHTLRGLHYQKPPHAQGKLVRVVRGSILDVAVDIRVGSPTFGRHLAVELSEADGRQLWVPPGFLHGFLTLTDGAEVIYAVSAYYDGASDAGIRWNDPDLAIAWPSDLSEPILSDKDAAAPLFRDAEKCFTYDG